MTASSSAESQGSPIPPDRSSTQHRNWRPAVSQQMHQQTLTLTLSLLIVCAAVVLNVKDGERVTILSGGAMLPELCMYKTIFNRPCPGCGLTRSVIACAHGNLTVACQYNEIGVAFFVLLVAQIPLRMGQILRLKLGKPSWQLPSVGWTVFPMTGALFIRWLIKLL